MYLRTITTNEVIELSRTMEARCKSLETIIIKLCDPIEQSNKRDI
jgi:hypothetical protein